MVSAEHGGPSPIASADASSNLARPNLLDRVFRFGRGSSSVETRLEKLENWHHRIPEKQGLLKPDHPRYLLPGHFGYKNGLPARPDAERILMRKSILASGKIWAYGLRNPWRYAFDAPILFIEFA